MDRATKDDKMLKMTSQKVESTFVGLGFLCIPNQDQTMNGTHAH